jgi:NAD(P)-dependent dehydrogenase (short-subunit alcohol dehydrogenase family)
VAGDGREPADVEAACAKAADANGEVDGVFVVAGGGGYVDVTDNNLEWCMEQYKLNVFPLVNVIKSVVPRMKKKGGSIVALSSTAAVCSYPKLSAYGAAKAALEFYAKVAADELGQHKIRINCVRSGFTKSGGTDRLMEDSEYLRRFKIITALDESYGQSEDFGPMVSMLLSPDTRWITGQVFAIDGGLTIRGYGGGIFPKGL